MPVGTQGTVKGICRSSWSPRTGAQMILANTYHLALRPGAEVVAALGGLHHFCGWAGPDPDRQRRVSSLQPGRKRAGRRARRHVPLASRRQPVRADAREGGRHPGAIGGRRGDGAGPRGGIARRAGRGARRGRADDPLGRAIAGGANAARIRPCSPSCRGGSIADLRVDCAERLAALDFPGYAVGGPERRRRAGRNVSRARFHGAGLAGRSASLFDGRGPAARPAGSHCAGASTCSIACCRRATAATPWPIPTPGRSGCATANTSSITRPLADDCPCLACRHSRGYLRHLFMAGEMLGPVLVSLHNLTYYQQLLRSARQRSPPAEFAPFHERKAGRLGMSRRLSRGRCTALRPSPSAAGALAGGAGAGPPLLIVLLGFKIRRSECSAGLL